ncbi:MAG: glycosyltransferase family 4 protein [Desulfarculaceae bacterium]|jgi:glycosyltransferase involved in cell wall biosynthesis
MAVLGFINTFDELAQADRRLGRKVANYDLTAALLEHSRAQELVFFLPFVGAAQPFNRIYRPWLEDMDKERKVQLLPALALPASLQQKDYLAIHAAEMDRYFPELCHLRNRWAKRPFPITCTTHTLSYWSTQVRNLYKVLPGPRGFDAVFCTSQAAKQHLDSAFAAASGSLEAAGLTGAGFPGQLKVVPLGVRSAEFGRETRPQAQKALGLEPGILTLLCLGRITRSDKFDLAPLLGAMAVLKQEMDLRLILAGSPRGRYHEELAALAGELGLEERVHFFLDFASEQKQRLYAAADVFVSPADNLQETFGLTILEAMASGLPVVASDFSGYRDLVQDGVSGFLIPTLGPSSYQALDAARPVMAEHIAALQLAQRTAVDMDALLQGLRRLLSSPELRQKMGRAGRKRVQEQFDWQVVVEQMEETWEELRQQANQEPEQPVPHNAAGAGLGELFGHFVTRAVSLEDHLTAGPLADAFSQGSWVVRPHPDLAGALPRQGLESILEAISKQGGTATLEELAIDLTGLGPPQQVEHLVLYGLKQGVLSLQREPGSS